MTDGDPEGIRVQICYIKRVLGYLFYMTLETIYIVRHGTIHKFMVETIPWLTES